MGYLPGTVEVVGHSAIQSIQPERRMLTIVDEAHRLTERVNYGRHSERGRHYEALRAIALTSTALLLLRATPVRSNEDAFLVLLHLLDPANYPLTDLAGFRRRVEIRDDLVQSMSAISAETLPRYPDESLAQISQLLPNDPVATELVSAAKRYTAARAEDEARKEISRLRIYVSESYGRHRRMVATVTLPRSREASPSQPPEPDFHRQATTSFNQVMIVGQSLLIAGYISYGY